MMHYNVCIKFVFEIKYLAAGVCFRCQGRCKETKVDDEQDEQVRISVEIKYLATVVCSL